MAIFDRGSRPLWQDGERHWGDPSDSAPYARQAALTAPGTLAVTPPTGNSPTLQQEVAFLNGLDETGRITNQSYWGKSGQTAYKWGDGAIGTGATITYSFANQSRFTAEEKATFVKSFAVWSSIADLTFVEVASNADADVLLKRGRDGGAYNSTPTTNGSGTTLGVVAGQALISIDTSVFGFDLSGSFDLVGGYGLSTVIHEIGHLIGLGHGGDYNGNVNSKKQQFSAYDNRMYTIMSYVSWTEDNKAKFAGDNPNQGTNWGISEDGYSREAPHTAAVLDILAIQQLYGVPQGGPLDGGQIYGFNSNIAGPIGEFFDFTQNQTPIVTIYNTGTGNTLDLSGYSVAQDVDLRPGEFSSVGGLTNNVAIAFDTIVETAIGGSGNDTIQASDVASKLTGGAGDDVLNGGLGKDVLQGGIGLDQLTGNRGQDVLTGDGGADTFIFTVIGDSAKALLRADTIMDFDRTGGDIIDLSVIDAIRGGGDDAFTFIGGQRFSGQAGELRFVSKDGDAFISGDVNGDGKADFTIHLHDVPTVLVTDFHL